MVTSSVGYLINKRVQYQFSPMVGRGLVSIPHAKKSATERERFIKISSHLVGLGMRNVEIYTNGVHEDLLFVSVAK